MCIVPLPLIVGCKLEFLRAGHNRFSRLTDSLLIFLSFLSQFFTDGITNKLLGCYVGTAMQDVVLVRIYGNKTELLIDRENEVKSFRVLHAHRCAPRLYCTFNNGLCYEFLQGAALEPEHIRSQSVFR